MIIKFKENRKTYIKKCAKCKSKFLFNYIDIDGYSYIKCPYCNNDMEVGTLHRYIFMKNKQKKHTEIENDFNKKIATLNNKIVEQQKKLTNNIEN